ncbi:MAG: APC family permease [Cyanobacteria bacterium J055]|nr:MAG: APC family permease [Cyanobacteria bacterium J055]
MTSTSEGNARRISLLTAICLVVANTIGTGVFTSLGFQVIDLKSGFVLLVLWVVGGIFALCGALSYGELGAMMPRSGGEYRYLSEIYHPALGFLSGWLSVTVGFAAPIALAAMSFGKYLASAIPGLNADFVAEPIAIIATICISLLHAQNLQIGEKFQDISTVLKVVLIFVFIACGLAISSPQPISFLPESGSWQQLFSTPFAISLVYVTYSYSGWNASVYLASELDRPEQNLPRSLFWGTIFVTALYVLLNFVFLYSTPIDRMAGELEVGYIAATSIFGGWGANLMGLLIAIGLISSMSSMVLAGSRVTQAIGEDIPVFKILGKTNRQGVPHHAIFFQMAIVLVLTIASTFESVITYLSFTLTLSSCLTVLGVFVYRVTHPEIIRPYKTWGYPITPSIFFAIGLWILVFIFQDKPIESLAGLATILLGLPIYWLANPHRRNSSIQRFRNANIFSFNREFSMKKVTAIALVIVASLISIYLQLCGRSKTAPSIEPQAAIDPANSSSVAPVASTPTPINPLAEFDLEKSKQLTDIAKFLAGIKVEKNPEISVLQESPNWINYAAATNGAWSKLEEQQLSAARQWSNNELKSINNSKPNLFYPFSGPDFLYADVFFPNASKYIFVGLEPVGALPKLPNLAQATQQIYNVQQSLYTLLQYSYFRTIDMRSDLKNNGVLPILYVFLARTNHTILDVKYVGLNPEGQLIGFYEQPQPGSGIIPGVQISFLSAGETNPQYLYYFSVDLSDAELQKTPQFLEFVKQQNTNVTYLKAASYLMHRDTFTTIRNFILERSKFVLQDDSGIPLRYFEEANWNRKFYGNYVSPIDLFAVRYQPDLRQVYLNNPNPQNLEFGIGYKFNQDANLMLFLNKGNPEN